MAFVGSAPDVLVSPEELEDSALFKDWIKRFGPGWTVERVYMHAALAWHGDVRMAFVNVTAIDPHGERRTVSAFLRGSTVDILPIIVAPDGTEYGVFVEQPRLPAGQMVVSTPAGMVDGKAVDVAALREIAEEVGGNIAWGTPQWLNYFATGSDSPMLVSPGGTDEDVQFCTVRAHLTEEQMRALQGSIAGAKEENERTTVHVVVLRSKALTYLARNGRPCMKSVLSLLLYERSRRLA